MNHHKNVSSDIDLSGPAIDLLRRGIFPDWWAFVPVSGKATYVKEWASKPLTREQVEEAYATNSGYQGLGVVTGEFSAGLIALDIDGPDADRRFAEAAGDGYEPAGQETTMTWTSGRPGRRQLFFRVPHSVVPELRHVKTLILRQDGEWHLGTGDVNRGAGGETTTKGDKPYEEVVLRFNQCQSVVPGSPHPSRSTYRFLQYNDRKVSMCPEWVMAVLRQFRKPVQWLSDADQKALDAHLGETAIPSRQIRGWFFKEEVQAKLRPRLADLIFNHSVFDKYGWKERSGNNPQMMSGCPWHGGESGTAFQYSVNTGCWDCKACGIGGDVLDFKHKIEINNMHAERPQGPDLERYVAEIATALGFEYPEDARAQVTKEVPRLEMDEVAFHEALVRIHDSEFNPAIRLGKMAGLAQATGRRLTGAQCLAAMDEYRYYEDSKRQNRKIEWWQNVDRMHYVIPGLLKAPSQTMLHAPAGVGKTSACMGLATAVGRGLTMRVRGIDVPVKQGPVLWIQNDQSVAKLLEDCEDNGINPAVDTWFHVRRGFQFNHTHEFAEWVKEIKPVLVVVDSISSCSTRMQAEEKEKGFASPFYWYSAKNGDPGPDGFPACSIIWVHHDNASGEARGSKILVAAMDEQWRIRQLTDDERNETREKGLKPASCRFIQIRKSRMGREGDRLVVQRDHNFAYSIWDFTPTERREDNGLGDPDPTTTCLRLVRDYVKAARASGGVDRLTAKEVWDELVQEMQGRGQEPPSSKTVKRWLDRWVTSGLLVLGKKKTVEGSDKPVQTYSLPPLRAYSHSEGDLSFAPSDPLQTLEKGMDTKEGLSIAPTEVVHCSGETPDEAKSNGQPTEDEHVVHCFFPVVASDLKEQSPKDTGCGYTRASVTAETQETEAETDDPVAQAAMDAPELGEDLEDQDSFPWAPVWDGEDWGDWRASD